MKKHEVKVSVHTTGRVSQVAMSRSVSQRYQAGDNSKSGNTGPSMKMLPKKLLKNRVMTKYRPRTDTAIWKRENKISSRKKKSNTA